MQAITVKYLPATDHKPSRFKATCDGSESATVSHDYSTNSSGQAMRACAALLSKLGWGGHWAMGGVKGGWVFVNTNSDTCCADDHEAE